jgi:hypothetical protein
MEIEIALPRLQVRITESYPEPDECILQFHIPFA